MKKLTFDAEAHRYFIDGQPRGSVTQIMQSAGLIDYSGMSEQVRKAALERGRVVHSITELHDQGELDPESVDSRLVGYYDAYKKFLDETGFKPTAIEHQGYNLEVHGVLTEGSYCGTLDRLMAGRFPGSLRVYLVDLKTGKAMWWVRVQTAAYAAFFPNPRIYERQPLELHQDGTYKMPTPYSGAEWRNDFNIFLSAFNIYSAKQIYGKEKAVAA